jgi:hypothetical protein
MALEDAIFAVDQEEVADHRATMARILDTLLGK